MRTPRLEPEAIAGILTHLGCLPTSELAKERPPLQPLLLWFLDGPGARLIFLRVHRLDTVVALKYGPAGLKKVCVVRLAVRAGVLEKECVMRGMAVVLGVAASTVLLGCWGCSSGGQPPPRLPAEPSTVEPLHGTPVGKGYAIAIGLNAIDPAHYGTDGALPGCEADANDMAQIATSLGYPVTKLLTARATRSAVAAALADHSQRLEAGDLLVVSYSGHGGQVPDQNGDEADGLDETWCLYDGELIDDELYAAWGKFKAGVTILVVSDSCHSGTVLRMQRKDIEDQAPDRTRELELKWKTLKHPMRLDRGAYVGSEAMVRAMEREPKLRDSLKKNSNLKPGDAGGFEVIDPRASREDDEVFVVRALPPQVLASTYSRNKAMYDKIGREVPKESAVPVAAAVLLLAACEDHQLATDIGFNGLFTWELKRAWAQGTFQGDYHTFHVAIQQAVLAANREQSPQLRLEGARDLKFEGNKPFTPVF